MYNSQQVKILTLWACYNIFHQIRRIDYSSRSRLLTSVLSSLNLDLDMPNPPLRSFGKRPILSNKSRQVHLRGRLNLFEKSKQVRLLRGPILFKSLKRVLPPGRLNLNLNLFGKSQQVRPLGRLIIVQKAKQGTSAKGAGS